MKQWGWAFAVWAVVCVIMVGVGQYGQQPQDVGPDVEKMASVSFAPFRSGQSPLQHRFPSASEVEDDLKRLSPYTQGLRTYAASEGSYDLPLLARRYGLKIWQGIWLGADPIVNAQEISKGIELAQRYPDVIDRVIVGNEVLLRRDLPVEALMEAIKTVKAQVPQRVTYADVWEFWLQFPQVADHVDIITIHLLPYWEDHPTAIDQALAAVQHAYQAIHMAFPAKPVAIGEAGWPSAGRAREGAIPSRVHEAQFVRGFIALADKEGFEYNVIEAFDQEWKYKNEGVVGANWGVFTADRTLKFPLQGPVVEEPLWRWMVGVGLGLGLLAMTLFVGRVRVSLARQLWISALAPALGVMLVVSAVVGFRQSYDGYLLVAFWANLASQSLMAFLGLTLMAYPGVQPWVRSAQASSIIQRLQAFDVRQTLGVLMWASILAMMVLQALLVVDGRYREWPLETFGVVFMVFAYYALYDRTQEGVQALLAGSVLLGGAVALVLMEGGQNPYALVWSALSGSMGLGLLYRVDRARLVAPSRMDLMVMLGLIAMIGLVWWFRGAVVEPRAWATFCAQDSGALACYARQTFVWLQQSRALGLLALVVGLYAFFYQKSQYAVYAAIALGALAVLHHQATWGMLAVMLGLWGWSARLERNT